MNIKTAKHIGLRGVLIITLIAVMAVAAYATSKLVTPSTDKVELVDKSKEASFDLVVNSEYDFAGVEFGLEPSTEEVMFKSVSYDGDFSDKENVKTEKNGVTYFGVFDGTNTFKTGEKTVATVKYEYAGAADAAVKLKTAQVVRVDENGEVVSENVEEVDGFTVSLVRKDSDAVAAFKAEMSALSDTITLNDKDKVEALKSQYDALSEDQKSMIDDAMVIKLTNAVATIGSLQKEAYEKAHNMANATVTGIVAKRYNGRAQVQNPTVKIGGTTLKKGTDYTLSYKNNVRAGKNATVIITGKGIYKGTIKATYTITKAANPLTIKAKTATVKGSTKGKKGKLKKNKTLAVGKVISFTKKGQGKMTYTKASGNKKITINKTTGKVTVKKGLKKGTYKVKVKVKAAGNTNYKASAWKTVTFKVKVK